MQISLSCELGKLWNNTIDLTKTHRIICIQPTYSDIEDVDDKHPQVVTGYVIIAERLDDSKM